MTPSKDLTVKLSTLIEEERAVRAFLSNILHNYVYGQMAPQVANNRIEQIVEELCEMRNSP